MFVCVLFMFWFIFGLCLICFVCDDLRMALFLCLFFVCFYACLHKKHKKHKNKALRK